MIFYSNNCAACTLIANDIDTIKRSKNTTTSLRSILDSDEKSFCDTLGYNHSPYGWLEDLCEEMLEERLGTLFIIHVSCSIFESMTRISTRT